jgi:hypothetical protein
MSRLYAHVYQALWAVHHPADQNVLSVLTAALMRHVQIRNVEILVLELVVWELGVKSSITIQYAAVHQD